MASCFCGSGREYADCCRLYHMGDVPVPTAEALMRSRYSAYALKLSSYLADTWHFSTRPAALDVSIDETPWLSLEILACGGGGEDDRDGWVEFVAYYHGGQLHEKSWFVREAGHWFYLEGAILPPVTMAKPGRNDPCSCGSGKKYKKCCG